MKNEKYIQPLAELMFLQVSASMLAGSIENGAIEDLEITDWN